MSKEKRLKRIDQLEEKIYGVMERTGAKPGGQAYHLIKQYQKAIELHKKKLN